MAVAAIFREDKTGDETFGHRGGVVFAPSQVGQMLPPYALQLVLWEGGPLDLISNQLKGGRKMFGQGLAG